MLLRRDIPSSCRGAFFGAVDYPEYCGFQRMWTAHSGLKTEKGSAHQLTLFLYLTTPN
jgi:hypothetical protein